MKRVVVFFSFILLGLITSLSAQATKLYKWVDKDGHISYQDSPPPAESGQVQEEDIGHASLGTDDGNASSVAEKFPVVLYAVPKCAACDLARAYLQKRKVPFTEKNVENDAKMQQEMKGKTGGELSVPTITVGTKVMRGYMESLLEGELDDAGYPKLANSTAQTNATSTTDQ